MLPTANKITEVLENTKYTLRRVNKDKWAPVIKYKFAKDGIGSFLDDQGLPITGLTENTAKGKEVIKGTRVILEEKMGLDAGTLARGSMIKPNDFWVSFAVEMPDKDIELDTSTPENELKVRFLAAQPHIALGPNEIRAKTEYLLFTEQDQAVLANKQKTNRRKAYAAFEALTEQDRSDILTLSGTPAVDLSPAVIENKLSDWMEEYPAKFLALAKDPARPQKTFINQCLSRGIMHIEDDMIYYGETILGVDVPSAAQKLFSKESIDIVNAIKTQIGQ